MSNHMWILCECHIFDFIYKTEVSISYLNRKGRVVAQRKPVLFLAVLFRVSKALSLSLLRFSTHTISFYTPNSSHFKPSLLFFSFFFFLPLILNPPPFLFMFS